MQRRAAIAGLMICLAGFPFASHAEADSSEIYEEYRATARIVGCDHSVAELQEAAGSIPADILAYDPGFSEAIDLALQERLGGCLEGDEVRDEAPPPAAADGSPGPIPPTMAYGSAPVPDPGGGGLVVVLLALAGVCTTVVACSIALASAGLPGRPRR